MKLPRPIQNSLLLLTLVLAAQKARAQLAPADDFFHSGAQFYISNNIPQAKEQVEMGLKFYPDDDKLKKLELLLKQQQQQQSQQNQQQQNQQSQSQQSKDQQKSQPQKSKDQKDQQQNSSDQQKQDEEKQAAQKKADDEKKAEQQKASAGKQDDKKPEDKNEDGQPVAAGQMTPEEAKRLLDAQKGNEQFLQLKPTEKPRDARRTFKDW